MYVWSSKDCYSAANFSREVESEALLMHWVESPVIILGIGYLHYFAVFVHNN